MVDVDISFLEGLYLKLKDLGLRKKVLQCLAYGKNNDHTQFFLSAYKKERYLDMKLDAVRGYANHASENEVEKLMQNFMQILKKRSESTPYNYQEYEFLRSSCGLPYLVKRFGYTCFKDVLQQEEKQYSDMPDAFKGFFTFDEDGNLIELMKPEKIRKQMDDFFKQRR